LLLENGASPDDRSSMQFFGGKSAFDIAMDLNDTAIVDILFRHGVYDLQSLARYSQARSRSHEDLQLPQNTSATTDPTSCSNNVPTEKAQFRTWTDQSASFTIEAELLCLDRGLVTLRSRNDKQISIPISKISRQDLDYIDGVLGLALEIDRSQDTGPLPLKKGATVLSGEDVGASSQFQKISGNHAWFAFFLPVQHSLRPAYELCGEIQRKLDRR
jgi:hypothetical protein